VVGSAILIIDFTRGTAVRLDFGRPVTRAVDLAVPRVGGSGDFLPAIRSVGTTGRWPAPLTRVTDAACGRGCDRVLLEVLAGDLTATLAGDFAGDFAEALADDLIDDLAGDLTEALADDLIDDLAGDLTGALADDLVCFIVFGLFAAVGSAFVLRADWACVCELLTVGRFAGDLADGLAACLTDAVSGRVTEVLTGDLDDD